MPDIKNFFTQYYKYLSDEDIKDILDTEDVDYDKFGDRDSLLEKMGELPHSAIALSGRQRPIGYLINWFKDEGIPDEGIKTILKHFNIDLDHSDEYYEEAMKHKELIDNPIEDVPEKKKKRISREVPETIAESDDEQFYRDVEDVLIRKTGYEDIEDLMELNFINFYSTIASMAYEYHRYYMRWNYPFFNMKQIEQGREEKMLQSLYRIHECSMSVYVTICQSIQKDVDVETVKDYYMEKWGHNIKDEEIEKHYQMAYDVIKLATVEEYLEYLLEQDSYVLNTILDGIDKYESGKILLAVIESKIADKRYLAQEIVEVVRNIMNLSAATLVITEEK